ncbi:MAG: quinolinate synthase NadA [Methanomicrobiales archaeon]|nr:quinolinate synthase NadA [Methanomicrobiales archaeon]
MQETGIAGRQGEMVERIQALKEERDAVILAHNYQVPAVQDLADLVGDSLELARAAATRDCPVIVFCGVDFMAETAAILSPAKTVLLPASDACCPMAQMVTAGEVEVLRDRYPGAAVVCYVNTTAAVKAASDICCTSANAVRVVRSLEEDRVIFVPDRNLALYTARFTDKEIIPWEGFCIVHDRITPEEVREAKHRYPGAEVIVHPECRPEVIDLADQVSSTSGMVRYVCESPKETFVIGTEVGILYRMRKLCPGKQCVPLSPQAICTNMKKTTPALVLRALETMGPRITVPEEVAAGARAAIERMLAIR